MPPPRPRLDARSRPLRPAPRRLPANVAYSMLPRRPTGSCDGAGVSADRRQPESPSRPRPARGVAGEGRGAHVHRVAARERRSPPPPPPPSRGRRRTRRSVSLPPRRAGDVGREGAAARSRPSRRSIAIAPPRPRWRRRSRAAAARRLPRGCAVKIESTTTRRGACEPPLQMAPPPPAPSGKVPASALGRRAVPPDAVDGRPNASGSERPRLCTRAAVAAAGGASRRGRPGPRGRAPPPADLEHPVGRARRSRWRRHPRPDDAGWSPDAPVSKSPERCRPRPPPPASWYVGAGLQLRSMSSAGARRAPDDGRSKRAAKTASRSEH